MLHTLHTFLFWWFLWWLLYKSHGVLGAQEEREYVHIKVHMPDIVRKHNHYHKALHKHQHPRVAAQQQQKQQQHRPHGFKKVPAPEMTYYSEDPRGVNVMATPYLPGNINMAAILNAPNEDNSLMAAPNYGPALFGHDDISAPTPMSMTSTGPQQLMQQLFTPEMMSAAMTAMAVGAGAAGGGGFGAAASAAGVDTNMNTLMPNAATSADDFLAVLQREYSNMYGGVTTAASSSSPLQQQLRPSRSKPRKHKKRLSDPPKSKAKQMPASYYTASKQMPSSQRRRPGQQHNGQYNGHYKRARPRPYTDEPNEFDYNKTPSYLATHEDDINADDNDDEDHDAGGGGGAAAAAADDDVDDTDADIDDDGFYDYEEAKSSTSLLATSPPSSLGAYGQRYNSIMDSSTGTSSGGVGPWGGPLSYQEFMYSVDQHRPTMPTRLKWPQQPPQAYATPGNDINGPPPSPSSSSLSMLHDLQPFYQSQQQLQQHQPLIKQQLQYQQQAAALSSSPASVPLKATTTRTTRTAAAKQQRYKKRQIRNKSKRNRIDF